MHASLIVLRSRKDALANELRQVRSQCGSERKRARRVQQAAARAWKLSTELLHPTLIMYFLCDCVATPAVAFLRRSGRQRHWPPRDDQMLRRLVEDAFIEVDMDSLVQLTDVDDPLDSVAMNVALRYIQEWKIVQWGCALNSHHGVAPSTASIVRQAANVGTTFPSATFGATRTGRPDRCARMWATRFRRRWGARLGKIRVREHMPADQMQTKAPLFISFTSRHACCDFPIAAISRDGIP